MRKHSTMGAVADKDSIDNRQTILKQTPSEVRINLYDCIVCNLRSIVEKDTKNHHEKWHADIPHDQNIFKLVEFTSTQIKIFGCVVCNARHITENDIKNHHLKRHKDIPIDQNIFKLVAIKDKPTHAAVSFEQCSMSTTNVHQNATSNRMLATTLHHNAGPIAGQRAATMNKNLPTVEPKMFECKLCRKNKIREDGLEGHHFSKHRNMLFDAKNFQEYKQQTSSCIDQNELVKESTSEQSEWTVLNPFDCQTCGARSLRRYNNNAANPSNQAGPLDQNVCETCAEELLKKQALEKQRLEKKQLEEKLLREKQLKEKLLEKKLWKEKLSKKRPFQKQPSQKYLHNLALVHKETIKYYRCMVCHRSGITEDQFMEHPFKNHGVLCTIPQNTFELIETIVYGHCSVCGQRVDEEQFIEHSKQVHSQILISTRTKSSMGATGIDEQDSSDSDNANSDKTKVMSINEVMKVIPGKQKASVQKIMNIEHTPPPKLYKCVICGADGVNEQNMAKHRAKLHSDIPATDQDFVLSTKGKGVKCEICCAEMKGGRLEGHMRRVHPDVLKDEKVSCDSETNELFLVHESSNTVILKLYKCLVCGAGDIMEQNLIEHHSKKHDKIPTDTNIFHLIGNTHRDKCNVCDKHMKEGQLKAHKIRFHSHVRRDCVYNRSAMDTGMDTPTSVRTRSAPRPQLVHRFQTTIVELYKCGYCSASGLLKDQLINHSRQYHKAVVEIDYHMSVTREKVQCLCESWFWPNKFAEHMHQSHPLVEYTCVGQNGQLISKNIEHMPVVRKDPVKMFKCNACNATSLLEKYLERHRLKCPKEMSPSNVTFELMVTKKRCKLCHKRLKEEHLENHMNLSHPRINAAKIGKVYKCGLCDAWCMKHSFKEHHTINHSHIPFANNRFKYGTIKQKFSCDFCERRICDGRKKKHQLKACLQYVNKKKMWQKQIYSNDEQFE
ncbi:uncharacterized protein LOC129579548 [Sitodiplosis mosellana]|uniref:uncharacterized protein LOC129579548 n=1 Tax=Sitodiplosis mosellana TaxID=263140 RepID=UPI00244433A8|nr:uncharacterized protein LOC129579548 [Sitodiplosis mosellana]